jgi:hypothetical protein
MRLFAPMRRHPRVTLVAIVAALGLMGFGMYWFQPHKLFIDDRVEEAVPVAEAEASADADAGSADGRGAPPEESPGDDAERAEPTVLAEGRVRPLDHGPASGRALVIDPGDGRTFLRLEDLAVDNGPDLRVYLSTTGAREGAVDEEAFLEEFVDLGRLKGNLGSSNYRIPDGVDLDRYSTAVVWCERFTVGFAVAALS